MSEFIHRASRKSFFPRRRNWATRDLLLHGRVLCTDSCFYDKGTSRVAPRLMPEELEEIFRHKVFKMLLCKGKITEDLARMLSGWKHSGFNVFYGPRINPPGEEEIEEFTRYTIRASLFQERTTYMPEQAKVNY